MVVPALGQNTGMLDTSLSVGKLTTLFLPPASAVMAHFGEGQVLSSTWG